METNLDNEYYAWKKRNSLKAKEAHVLLECYRRFHMFHKNKGIVAKNFVKEDLLNIKLFLLGTPSYMKGLDVVKASYTLTPNVTNWFKLTERGATILSDFNLQWDKSFNARIFGE